MAMASTKRPAPAPNDGTVAGCVTILAEAFGKVTSPAMFRAYEIGLQGLTPDDVKAATHQALGTCRFMPAPAELRELVVGRLDDRAVQAWLAFEEAVMRHGYLHTVTFDDPVINATVRAVGGWEHCCGMPATEFDTFLQKRFQDTYKALARFGVSEAQAAPLVGWIDRENAMLGYDPGTVQAVTTGLAQGPEPKRIAGK